MRVTTGPEATSSPDKGILPDLSIITEFQAFDASDSHPASQAYTVSARLHPRHEHSIFPLDFISLTLSNPA